MTHQGPVTAVAFSPDGKTVLTGSTDRHGAAVGRSPPASPSAQPLFQSQDSACFVAFSPDGKTVLTEAIEDTARLWDAATGRPWASPWTIKPGLCRGLQPRRPASS